MSLLDPWPRLGAVRHFRITIETQAGPNPVHTGLGEIRVEPTTNADNLLVWREEGCWTSGPLKGTRFHNLTQWTRRAGELQLDHLRRGPENPTFLATLHRVGPDRWEASEPHLCGPDCYLPTLLLRESGVQLRWEVRSPTDPYILTFLAGSSPNQL